MMSRRLYILLLLAGCIHATAATIRGKVHDNFNEPLIGAHITIEQLAKGTVAGLDGSFTLNDLQPGTYHLVVSFIGYVSYQQDVVLTTDEQTLTVLAELKQDATELNEVTITAQAEGGSEAEARSIERNSPATLNVVSAKAIALSPDLSVANVVQRVSGLSVERSSNGDPQYAIVRGMDKRYSYTLVNGVKIPSPDNKNRYVPLDIFPSSLLERLEVYKSLTANLEGDAMGGAVNMVMKSAPETLEIKGDLQLGYNYINYKDGFNSYNANVVKEKSPRELYGIAYQAQAADFTRKNLEVTNAQPIPDMLATLSVGNRFLRDKLGFMLGTSFQNSYRSTKSIWFDSETDRFGSNLPALSLMQDRYYSTLQKRLAIHSRIDYRFNKNNEVNLYAAYFNLGSNEVRDIRETYLDGRNYSSASGNAILAYRTRTRTTQQGIYNATLQGKHTLINPLTIDWSAVYSLAKQQRPDNAEFIRNGELKNFIEQPVNVERRNPRQWERNTDQDYTGYLHLTFQPAAWQKALIKAGTMYRKKDRDNYFNRYLFDPNPGLQVQGVNWNTFFDVKWEVVNPAGSASDEMNYKARENVSAYYLLSKTTILHTEINAGVRVEHTVQGYTLKSPKENQTPDTTQTYTDVLPSLSLKYMPTAEMNVRFSYYKAISRPGFFEIVPYNLQDDGFDEAGNTSLHRVKADNIDLRWEYFPNTTDQLLIGAFYKKIKDPIEYAVVRSGVNNEPVITPGNYGTAYNMGIELDFSRYFNKIGIKGNYTFTHSQITTTKAIRTREVEADPTSNLIVKEVEQTRSLQGQARHIGNLSLLYKDIPKGLEAQLAAVYTGERLEVISPFLDNDMYARPTLQLDLSLQKRISSRFEIFARGTNLLNSPYEVYIKKPLLIDESTGNVYPYQKNAGKETLVRRDQYYQSIRLGLRFNL